MAWRRAGRAPGVPARVPSGATMQVEGGHFIVKCDDSGPVGVRKKRHANPPDRNANTWRAACLYSPSGRSPDAMSSAWEFPALADR